MGQNEKVPAIKVISASTDAGIVIRWAPNTPVAWQIGNDLGYKVTRYTLTQSDSLSFSEKKVLTSSGIYVLQEQDWEALANENKWAAIAAQAVYGEDFTFTDPGAGPSSFVNEATELENRFSFSLLSADISAPVAEALGLRWVDVEAEKGQTYVYQVALMQQRDDYRVDKGSSKIFYADKKPLPKPQEVQAEFGDKNVSISWNTFYLDGIYSSYIVERSDDNGQSFATTDDLQFFSLKKEGSGPLEKMYYLDSIPQNSTVYQYRVRGITPFGELGPPSDPVIGEGAVSLGDAVPVIKETVVLKNGEVNVTWKFAPDLLTQVKSFSLSRGPKAAGPFETIVEDISPSKPSYLDTIPLPVNYYVVKAYGKNGEVRRSFPTMVQLEDSIPPAMPKGLVGEIDKKGIVKINWASNSEPDLYGYRIFKTNSLDQEFIQVTKEALDKPAFKDSINLNTLTENVYYTVTAQDRRYNQSEYAKPLVLKRPDIVPPEKPVIKSIKPIEGGVIITWYPTSSTDLALYKLFRKKTESNIWKEFEISKDSSVYTDKMVDTGTGYDYSMLAIDDDQLASDALKFSAQPLSVKMSLPAKPKIIIDRTEKYIELIWDYKMAYTEVVIYRSENHGPLRLFKRLDGDLNTFRDQQLRVGGSYSYRLKFIGNNGGESPISKAANVQY